MKHSITYPTALLREQLPKIHASRIFAVRMLANRSYFHGAPLFEHAAPETRCYAVSLTPIPDELPEADEKAKQIREVIPDFRGDPATYRAFREQLGKPKLSGIVLALAKRFPANKEFKKQLAVLVSIHKACIVQQRATRKRFNRDEVIAETERLSNDSDALAARLMQILNVRNKGKASRKMLDRRTAEILINGWLLPEEHLFKSFCFCSDLAIAKLLWWQRTKRPLPLERLDTEPRRVKIIYQRLGLLPARPRAIRDITHEKDSVNFIRFGERRPELRCVR